jgi:hypothetical protein
MTRVALFVAPSLVAVVLTLTLLGVVGYLLGQRPEGRLGGTGPGIEEKADFGAPESGRTSAGASCPGE